MKSQTILSFFRQNIIGYDEVFDGPFGSRRIMYCDWTASGKALRCVEDYITNEVLSLYANTHTETSITGIQMTHFRHEARDYILKSCHGRKSRDVVFFCGTGATGAISKLAGILQRASSFNKESTVVFIGPYEHNSNILIWKEMGVHLVIIPESSSGGVDQLVLKDRLIEFEEFNLRIGSFSAASNVSGIQEDVTGVTRLLHENGALAFWDFASGAPYMSIEMTCAECRSESELPASMSEICVPDPDRLPRSIGACACLDAVYISPHKFMGGPGTPGILVAKRTVIVNDVPVVPGGGTVSFSFGPTAGAEYEYKDDISEREEGGTQDIIGSIRASLAFMVKDAVSVQRIEEIERNFIGRVLSAWEDHPNIRIVGHTSIERVATFSFYIVHEWNGIRKSLHHNFVAALLNDLFGIQGRGGCSCAGLYGKQLLKLTPRDLDKFVCALKEGNELSRPGFMRVNFHYIMTDEQVDYVIQAVLFLAEHGWKFVPLYQPIFETSEWFHVSLPEKAYTRRSLNSIRFEFGMSYEAFHRRNSNDSMYETYLREARVMVERGIDYPDNPLDKKLPRSLEVEWFWTPSDILHELFPNSYKGTITPEEAEIIKKNRLSVTAIDISVDQNVDTVLLPSQSVSSMPVTEEED